MSITYRSVELPDDVDPLVEFLCAHDWQFHGTPRPTPAEVRAMEFVGPDVASFWIIVAGQPVGLIRLFDLGDLDRGSPLFDLRLAPGYRGRGIGTQSVRWLSDYLLTTYPPLHRIEANTRHDNDAMQRVLEKCGYQLEGRLREAWLSDSGTRHDTFVYGLLRPDWVASSRQAGPVDSG